METLEKLFGSSARVKILRLFLMNANEIIEKNDVQKRAKVTSANATKELNMLEKIDILKTKSFFKEKEYKTGNTKKVRQKGYIVNSDHKLFISLQSLLINNSPMTSSSITNKLGKSGKLKLIIVSGIFIQDPDSRIDLLVVGDSLRENTLRNTITAIEAEIGKQIRYAVFQTEDFKYRLGVYDRLVKDIMDYPHQVILDKIGL